MIYIKDESEKKTNTDDFGNWFDNKINEYEEKIK